MPLEPEAPVIASRAWDGSGFEKASEHGDGVGLHRYKVGSLG